MTYNNGNQARVLHHYKSGMSAVGIARELGISRSTVRGHLRALARVGQAPGLIKAKDVPGFAVSKTTIQLGPDGNILQEWRRMKPEFEDAEKWVETLEDRVACKGTIRKGPEAVSSDLLLEIPIPDHHLGMLAWQQETGADYDCSIAKKLLVNGVRSVIEECPRPKKILLVAVGDYYHSDNRNGVTEKAGHALDTDSRYAKRIEAGIDAFCCAIELAAQAAKEVEVLILSGNHDWHSAKWLSLVLAAYYKDSKRVKVNTDPRPQQWYQHGKVLLSYMHGDTMKASHFARVIPATAKEAWAATEFRYGRVAHWHHRSTEEYPGIVMETLPTLCAPDAFAAEHGYLSRRAITAFLWSAKYGLRAKLERGPAEIMEGAK